MIGHLNIDGSVEIASSKSHFIAVGIKSAATGAALSWLIYKHTSWSVLGIPIATVFTYWVLRALAQGLFVPELLTLRFYKSKIEGPCLWWLLSEDISASDVDWTRSGIMMGRLIVMSKDERRIYTKLGWYGPEGAAEIERQWLFFRNMHVSIA